MQREDKRDKEYCLNPFRLLIIWYNKNIID